MVLSGPSTSEARSCHPKAEEANIIYMTWMNPYDLISLAFKRLPRTRNISSSEGQSGILIKKTILSSMLAPHDYVDILSYVVVQPSIVFQKTLQISTCQACFMDPHQSYVCFAS